jgi:hypothetical protein
MKRGLTLLFIFALIIGLMAYFLTSWYFSEGSRAGTVSKLSKRGYVFKTHEGELNEGGFSGETGSLTPRIWHFSTKEDSVVKDLERAMATGERVTLKYQEKVLQFPWNGDTKYFVIDVEFLGIPAPAPKIEQLPPPPPAPADSNSII